jgi:hypothetical protein
MKKSGSSTLIVLLMFFILSSCKSADSGPTVWIDQPLGGSEFPVSPITIQAHASDTDGVAHIAFFVMDEKVGEQPVGGGRLENASILWQPTVPGNYQLAVEGTDNEGNKGSKARVEIIIAGEDDATQTPTPAVNLKTQTPSPYLTVDQCAKDNLDAPVLLSPQNGITIEGQPQFSWAYPDGTCHPSSYVIDVSHDASFNDVSLGFGTVDFNETSRQWPLSAGQCYYWQVRAIIPGVDGPKSPAWSFCIAPPPDVTIELPSITMDQDANCRTGPGTNYEAVDFAAEGSKLKIEGRNEQNSWFLVLPSVGASKCWISGSIGTISGDPSDAPVVDAASLPIQTGTETPTSALPPALIITTVVDFTPPVISSIEYIPPVIAASGPVQCPGYVDVDIIVSASDNSGYVDLYAEIPSLGVYTKLLPTGSHFQQAVSPGSIPGTISVIIHAYDAAGNHTSANWSSFTVIPCIQ